jgi:hypothetical protein
MSETPITTTNTNRGPVLTAYLLAFVAGIASGWAFAQVFGGGFWGLIISYASPLLLYAAGLGAGRTPMLVAFIASLLGVFLQVGDLPMAVFAIMLGLPALIVCRAALMTRADGTMLDTGVLLQILLVIGVVMLLGVAALLNGMGSGLNAGSKLLADNYAATLQQVDPSLSPEMLADMVAVFTTVLPSLLVISWLFVHLVNIGIAQGLLRSAGKAQRADLSFATLTLPVWMVAAFAATAAGSMVTAGDIGTTLAAIASLLGAGFTLVGLVVLHMAIVSVCRKNNLGNGAKFVVFFVYYGVVMMLQFPLLLALVVGLADPWVKFRSKFQHV